MTVWTQVTIVGVGLIGGSIGRGLLSRGLATRVVGFGQEPKELEQAAELNAITHGELNLSQAVEAAEIVVVCTPVDQIAPKIRELVGYCSHEAIITDVGSTKQEIVSDLGEGSKEPISQYLGSHPLAGSEQSGVASSSGDLFVDRLVALTPTSLNRPEQVQSLTRFWNRLGARVESMSPERHDQAMAEVSHLPHLLSSGIAAATDPSFLSLAATGWLDTTRIAAGPPSLWVEILFQNRSRILSSLSKFESNLQALRAALENNDRASLFQQLEKGKNHRDAVGS